MIKILELFAVLQICLVSVVKKSYKWHLPGVNAGSANYYELIMRRKSGLFSLFIFIIT